MIGASDGHVPLAQAAPVLVLTWIPTRRAEPSVLRKTFGTPPPAGRRPMKTRRLLSTLAIDQPPLSSKVQPWIEYLPPPPPSTPCRLLLRKIVRCKKTRSSDVAPSEPTNCTPEVALRSMIESRMVT